MNVFGLALWIVALGLGGQSPETRPCPDRATTGTFTLWQLPAQTHSQIMSYVVRTERGNLIVLDGGVSEDAPYLKEFLSQRGGKVAAWFLTHPHADHVLAFMDILAAPGPIEIGKVYASLPDEAWIGKHCHKVEIWVYQRLAGALKSAKRAVIEPRLGDDLDIDGIRIEVLGVKNPEIHGNAINNSSMVLRFSDRRKSVLFLADLGAEGGDKLLASAYRARLASDYVQMAHHGQRGVSEAFYKVVSPRYCLWPTPKWLWENDKGQGKGSGSWETLTVRAWMDKLDIKRHYVMFEGLHRID
ncbi:MAG: MBL fold metallo-hydrolase [Phycisphaerae bacterium]|nr:MBL fold metallo-hydrolase [Phycisphaerae bacterium]